MESTDRRSTADALQCKYQQSNFLTSVTCLELLSIKQDMSERRQVLEIWLNMHNRMKLPVQLSYFSITGYFKNFLVLETIIIIWLAP